LVGIISMSLGTSGSSDGTDTVSLAVNSAVERGLIAVVAAGNSGPARFTIGSPGAAAKAITVRRLHVQKAGGKPPGLREGAPEGAPPT
jgi:subtilisin family serine protease